MIPGQENNIFSAITSYLLLGLYHASVNKISIVLMQITPKMNGMGFVLVNTIPLVITTPTPPTNIRIFFGIFRSFLVQFWTSSPVKQRRGEDPGSFVCACSSVSQFSS